MRFLRKQTPQMSIERFADRAKLRRMSVQRLVNGERWRHLDVNVLIPVIDAAGAMGLRLDFRDFARGTAIPIEDAERQWAPRSRTGV